MDDVGVKILLDLIGLARSVGIYQWKRIGEMAANDAMAWLAAVDRVTEAVNLGELDLAIDNIRLASEIENKWALFDTISPRVIEALNEEMSFRLSSGVNNKIERIENVIDESSEHRKHA